MFVLSQPRFHDEAKAFEYLESIVWVRCGASSDEFRPWEASAGDDTYWGMKCGKCGNEVSWTQV